jgi:uncharacterized protein DUF6232
VSNSTHTALGHPGDQHDVTLYRRPGVLVTRRWLVVNSQRYPIRDLRNLRTAQGDRRPIGSGTVIAAGSLLVVVIAVTQCLAMPALLAAAVGLVVPTAVLAIAVASAPRACELWAEYRGMTVQLLWLDDREQYNQICRALTRAKECQR